MSPQDPTSATTDATTEAGTHAVAGDSDASTEASAGGLTEAQLKEELEEVELLPGELLYIAQRAGRYRYRRVDAVGGPAGPDPEGGDPDAWMYYAGAWPTDDDDWDEFFQDLLDELNSMTGGYDRCRWPLNEPYN